MKLQGFTRETKRSLGLFLALLESRGVLLDLKLQRCTEKLWNNSLSQKKLSEKHEVDFEKDEAESLREFLARQLARLNETGRGRDWLGNNQDVVKDLKQALYSLFHTKKGRPVYGEGKNETHRQQQTDIASQITKLIEEDLTHQEIGALLLPKHADPARSIRGILKRATKG